MRIGTLVKWKYSPQLFVTIGEPKNLYDENVSIRVHCVRTGKDYNVFLNDLEVICK